MRRKEIVHWCPDYSLMTTLMFLLFSTDPIAKLLLREINGFVNLQVTHNLLTTQILTVRPTVFFAEKTFPEDNDRATLEERWDRKHGRASPEAFRRKRDS